MESAKADLFDVAEKKLAWIARRQNVLASNIANANTPGFRAADLKPFSSVLDSMEAITPVRTQSAHLNGSGFSRSTESIQDDSSVRSVDGNSVALDQQLRKVADTQSSQSLVTSIWKTYVGMFNTALGKAG